MNKRIKVVRGSDRPEVVPQIIIRPVNRQTPAIDKWRNYHRLAEYLQNPSRVNLYDMYDDVMLDGHLTGITGKRLRSTRNKRLRFVDGGEQVEEMEDFITSKECRYIRKRIHDSLGWGLSGMEFTPGGVLRVKEIPRKHIKPHLKIISREQLDNTPVDGGEYEKNPFLWIIENEDDPLGYLLKTCPYAIFKRGNFGDWAEFIELYGRPTGVYRYEPGDDLGRQQLEEIITKAGTVLSMMIPKSVEYEAKDGKTTNSDGQLQERFNKACDDQNSIIVLGNTETTKSSSSSGYAQSQTHADQQLEITQDDMDYELDWLNDQKFLDILRSYGYPVGNGKFVHEMEANTGKLKERIEIDKVVAEIVPVSDDYFYDTYKIPRPENYDELKALKRVDAPEPTPPPTKPDKGKPGSNLSYDQPPGEGWLRQLRIKLADFFDPAHH